MDSLNQSLIEKLEKAQRHVSEMMPSYHRLATSNFNSGLKEAIYIIRQHEADMGDASTRKDEDHSAAIAQVAMETVPNSTSPTNLRQGEIPEDTNKLCEAQNAYLRAMEPVSIKRATEAFLRETDVFGGTTGAGLRRAFESVGVKYHEN